MVKIKILNIEGITKLPVQGTPRAAGYDIVAVGDPKIVGESVQRENEFYPFWKRIDYIEYKTSLQISPQDNNSSFSHNSENSEYYHTLIHPRSSVRKYNLLLANSIGLIDNDFRGEILCCFKYVWQPEDYIIDNGAILGKLNRERIYKSGDLIGQLVASKTNPMEFVFVNNLDATIRGEGGFGSTDKKILTITNDKKDHRNELKSVILNNDDTKDIQKSYGHIVDKYNQLGGVSVKKKYSDEVKERSSQNE